MMLKCKQRLNGSQYLMVASEGRTLADAPVYRIEILDDDGTCWDASFESLDVVKLVEEMGWWIDQDERNGLDWLVRNGVVSGPVGPDECTKPSGF